MIQTRSRRRLPFSPLRRPPRLLRFAYNPDSPRFCSLSNTEFLVPVVTSSHGYTQRKGPGGPDL